MKEYRLVKVKDYTVSACAEYNVSCPDAEDLFDAEDTAIDMVEKELILRDVDEIDSHITEENPSFVGYTIRVKVNMVIPVEAENYEEALRLAEGFLDDMNLPKEINLVSVGAWDSALAEEKAYLLRCKGA